MSTFADAMTAAQKRLYLTNNEVAEYLHVSVSTWKRWKSGASEPHPLCKIGATHFFLNGIKEMDEFLEANKDFFPSTVHMTCTDNPIDFPKR